MSNCNFNNNFWVPLIDVDDTPPYGIRNSLNVTFVNNNFENNIGGIRILLILNIYSYILFVTKLIFYKF